MNNEFVWRIITLVLCTIVLWLIRFNINWLKSTIADKIQQAEALITGSKLGAEKKAWVIAQLRLVGIKANMLISWLIDWLVGKINREGAWLANAGQTAGKGGEQNGNG